MKIFASGGLLAVVLLLQAGPARSDITPQCSAHLPAEHKLSFTDEKHRKWYARFWSGRCDGFSIFDFCKSGSPNWNEIVQRVSGEASAGERKAALSKACQVGRLIGFEWAKNNNMRCIHTSDLPGLHRMLETGGPLPHRLARLEAAARAKLGCRR